MFWASRRVVGDLPPIFGRNWTSQLPTAERIRKIDEETIENGSGHFDFHNFSMGKVIFFMF